MPHLVTQQGVNLASVVGWEHRGRSRWAENGWDQELCRNSHVSKEVIFSQRLAPVCIFFFYLHACVSVQIFWCLFKNIQLAGNLSQLVKEGSQMCRQHNQGLPKEKLASDANQHATGRARVLQLHWHADLLDLLFVAWTVTCVKGNCWPCCGAMSVKVLWNRLTELGLCCVRHFWSWIIQTVL